MRIKLKIPNKKDVTNLKQEIIKSKEVEPQTHQLLTMGDVMKQDTNDTYLIETTKLDKETLQEVLYHIQNYYGFEVIR